jgi:flavin-binding protein dodecin
MKLRRSARVRSGMLCEYSAAGDLLNGEEIMAKASVGEGVYRIIDVIGTSESSWEDATKNAVETAGKSLRDLRIAEVSKLDVKVEDGKVIAYRARVQLSFKYEG